MTHSKLHILFYYVSIKSWGYVHLKKKEAGLLETSTCPNIVPTLANIVHSFNKYLSGTNHVTQHYAKHWHTIWKKQMAFTFLEFTVNSQNKSRSRAPLVHVGLPVNRKSPYAASGALATFSSCFTRGWPPAQCTVSTSSPLLWASCLNKALCLVYSYNSS